MLARELREEPLPLSLLDLPPKDLGIAGAKLAITDNNTTGRFMNQEFKLDVIENADPAKLIEEVVQKVDAGAHFIIVDASPATLLKMADAVKGKEAILINYSAADDSLREENCRPQVLHTAPTRSMLTDALAQYLVWKKWPHWLLVLGPTEKDKLYAESLRRSAKRFGAKIVEERTFNYDSGSRRTDGGFEQVQQQIPTFTQNAPDYEVLVVADEGNLFGDYLPYRTWDARPVAGTAGLVAESWHPAIELWGGTQFQNRFKRLADRTMRPIDYNAWLAARMVGEAASRTKSAEFKDLVAYMKGPKLRRRGLQGRRAVAAQLERPDSPAGAGDDAEAAGQRLAAATASCINRACSTRSASISRKPNARRTHNERHAYRRSRKKIPRRKFHNALTSSPSPRCSAWVTHSPCRRQRRWRLPRSSPTRRTTRFPSSTPRSSR